MVGRAYVWILIAILAGVHLVVLSAGFFAPYDPTAQDREFPFAPPVKLRLVDEIGRWHLRPFIYAIREDPQQMGTFQEDRSRMHPLRFFVRGFEYELLGMRTNLHLFGTDGEGKLYLLGTDGYGRDQLSRLLYGGRVSLLAGLLATMLSLALGTALGTAAGFYGRWVDGLLMRFAELFLALPWLYLLFAVRAFLPLHISATEAFITIAAVIGAVGWAQPARLVRGIVLSARERTYVTVARGFGASDFYLLRRHIAPHTSGVLLTQGSVLLPQYILAEITLSFLGLGIAEPVPSWGNMLSALQQYHVLSSYWWMLLPGVALIPVFLAFFLLAGKLQERMAS